MDKKPENLFSSLYQTNYKETFMLGMMKVIPKERKVLLDSHFVEITGFDYLEPDKWIELDESGLIEFLKESPSLYEGVREVFNGETEADTGSVEFYTKKGKHVQVKLVINDRHSDGVPKELVAVFIDASYVENAVNEMNKLSAIFEASQEISRASTWWINYDEGGEYFYQSDSGAISAGLEPTSDKRYSIQEYAEMRDRAGELDEEYKAAVHQEILSFTDAWDGVSDNFGARTPLLTPQGKIVWTDSKGKVVLRYDDGSPRLVVAVDIFVNDEIENEAKLFKLSSIIDQGLENSNIGVWWHDQVDGKDCFHQTNSFREVMGIDKLTDMDVDSVKWQEYLEDFKRRYPMYISYLDKDAEQFRMCVEGGIDSYQNTIPVLFRDESIKWVEVRATVVKRDETGKSSLMVGVNVDVTDRMKTEELILELQRKNFVLNNANRNAIETAGLLVWSNDRVNKDNSGYYYANDAYINTLGLNVNEEGHVSLEEYYASMFPDEEGNDGRTVLRSKYDLMMAGKIKSFENVLTKHRNLKNGKAVFLEHFAFVQETDEEGVVTVIGGYIRDLTDQINIERENKELNLVNERLKRADNMAIKSGQVMVWYQDNEEFDSSVKFFGNDIFVDKLGLSIDSDGLMSTSEFRRSIYRITEEAYKYAVEFRKKETELDSSEIDSYEKVRLVHKNLITGELLYFDHYCEVESRYPDGYVKAKGGFTIDVTDIVHSRREIEYLANRDRLTGLYNRNYYEEYIQNKLNDNYSLIVLDLDGLKLINDTFGHYEGDRVITFASSLLTKYFEEDSVISRIGGDEFTIISETLNEDELKSRYANILEELTKSNSMESFDISLSFGHKIVLNSTSSYEMAFDQAENSMYRQKLFERRNRKSVTLDALLESLEVKTDESKEHSEEVANHAVGTLKELGYSRFNEVEDMTLLARVHDIGKLTIPTEILLKNGELTENEYEQVKKHAESGYKIISNIVDSEVVADGVLYHHERWDGTGYPMGREKDEIPLYARILSVCDAYSIMRNGRPYKKAVSKKNAIKELIQCSGSQFDESVVNAFIRYIEKSDT